MKAWPMRFNHRHKFLCVPLALLGAPTVAYAQDDTVLIQPAIPDGFDRGRNISVTSRARPDYAALGIPVNSFNLFPRVDVGTGFTDNVYLASNGRQADGFVFIVPSLVANSDWSRHQLSIRGSAQVLRFLTQAPRNQNSFNIGSSGRLDLGSSFALNGEAQYSKQYETPFSGELQSNLSVLSGYYRSYLSVRGQYQAGQGRAILALDRTTLDFDRLALASGAFRDQSDRNRTFNRITGQLEYAFTPSLSLYGQVGYGRTDYTRSLLNGQPNRDSDGVRALVGVNLDLAGLLRGTLGVGYTRRSYDSPLYTDASGVSVEAKIEYFPTELTTVTLTGRRVLADSNITATNAFFDNRVALRVDHELLRNLLLNATADFARQDYIGSTAKADIYRISGGARYLVSRRVGIEGLLSHSGQTSSNLGVGTKFSETRFQIGIYYQQ